jgi:hypothetical protein
MRPALALLAPIVLVAAATPAHADDDEIALIIDATMLYPRDGFAASSGIGAEMRFVDDDEPFTMSIGGFAAVGQQDEGGLGRDVFDIHFQAAAKLGGKNRRALVPYAGLGFDVLHVTTHLRDVTVRGTTLGISAVGGFMGTVGDRVMWRATAGYLGAIVPGTGDDLGGIVFQVGIGARLDD